MCAGNPYKTKVPRYVEGSLSTFLVSSAQTAGLSQIRPQATLPSELYCKRGGSLQENVGVQRPLGFLPSRLELTVYMSITVHTFMLFRNSGKQFRMEAKSMSKFLEFPDGIVYCK